MKLDYILQYSLKNLLSRKTRTILTITGVVIGVSAITFLTSLGYGFERMTTTQIASKETLNVFDAQLGDSDLTAISDENIAKIKSIENVEDVDIALSLAGKAGYGEIKTDLVIDGYDNKYFALSDTKLLKGKFFEDTDTDKAIVSTAALKLIGVDNQNFAKTKIDLNIAANKSLSPELEEGETRIIKNLEIIGLIDDSQSAYVIIPFKLMQKEMAATNYTNLKIKVKNKESVGAARSKVEELGFYTDYIGDTVDQINTLFTIFRYIISGFGIIAMLVAVLGMLNTLTVSLLERTREIGVLKCNGATKKVVWELFLSEGVVISIIGGALGIIFGIIIGESVNIIFNFYATKNGAEAVDFFYTPLSFIIMVIALTSVVGFLTGLYPASRATKIRVLDALKYE